MSNKRQSITAIIYDRKGNILSIGKNSYVKTHPLQARLAKSVGKEHCIYQHAEINAIVRLQDDSKAYRMVVLRYGSKGEPLNAQPCSICQKAIDEMTCIKIVEHT